MRLGICAEDITYGCHTSLNTPRFDARSLTIVRVVATGDETNM